MDETTLRRLAMELLDALPAEIPEPAERHRVSAVIAVALAVPEGEGRPTLIDALSGHAITRRWMREHGATEDEVRALPGLVTTPLGLYYVCPMDDQDMVLLGVPDEPPRCSCHKIPMILQQG